MYSIDNNQFLLQPFFYEDACHFISSSFLMLTNKTEQELTDTL